MQRPHLQDTRIGCSDHILLPGGSSSSRWFLGFPLCGLWYAVCWRVFSAHHSWALSCSSASWGLTLALAQQSTSLWQKSIPMLIHSKGRGYRPMLALTETWLQQTTDGASEIQPVTGSQIKLSWCIHTANVCWKLCIFQSLFQALLAFKRLLPWRHLNSYL